VPNVPQPQKLFLTHPMELEGDLDPVESCFGRLGESGGVGARLVHDLC
jgi:hypothetical protein